MSSSGNSWSLFCVRYAILLKHSSRYSRITNFCNDQWKNELVQKHDNSTRLSNLLFLIKHHAYVLAGSEPEILVPWGDYLRLPCRIRISNFLVSELQLHVNTINLASLRRPTFVQIGLFSTWKCSMDGSYSQKKTHKHFIRLGQYPWVSAYGYMIKRKINLSMNDGFTRAKSEINTGSI